MSPSFLVMLFTVVAFACAYALCELVLKRLRRSRDDDFSAG